MKYIYSIIFFITITQFLHAEFPIDSVEIVKAKTIMKSQANDLKFLTKDTLLCVGDDFYIRLIDVNGSMEMIPDKNDFRLISEIGNFNSISQSDNDTYIAGDKGTVVKFHSPHNFELMNSNTEQDIKLIENCNGSVVFIDTNNTLYVTTDFTNITSHTFENEINDILFTNNNIYLAADDGIAYLSTNLGISWTEHTLDTNNKDLIHVSISPNNRIYFSGETLLTTDLNLGSIIRSKINYAEKSIRYIDKLYPLTDSLSCAYLHNTGSNTFLVYFLNSSLDSIYTVPNYVLNPSIPTIIYSSKYKIGCLMKSATSILCFSQSNYLELSTPDQKYLILPGESQFYSLLDITSSMFTGQIDEKICTFNKNGDIIDTLFNLSPIDLDTLRISSGIWLWNKDSIIYVTTQLKLKAGKYEKIPGSRKILLTTDGRNTWDTLANQYLNFSGFSINHNNLNYYENDSLYRASIDFGKTWFDIKWPLIDGSVTYSLLTIDHDTHISVPFFWDDPNKISYYKTTDAGKTWNKLTWYEQEGNEMFCDGSAYLLFENIIPNLALLTLSDELYISYDNFETWNKYTAISFVSRPMFGKIKNTKYIFLMDSSFVYICNENIELEKKIENDFHKFDTISSRLKYLDNCNTLWATTYYKLYYFKLDQLLSVAYADDTEYTELVAFPNPATDYIELVRNDIDFNLGMIIDYTGKERKIISDINNGIDLKDFESGTYLLILVDNDGNPYRTKFVVTK